MEDLQEYLLSGLYVYYRNAGKHGEAEQSLVQIVSIRCRQRPITPSVFLAIERLVGSYHGCKSYFSAEALAALDSLIADSAVSDQIRLKVMLQKGNLLCAIRHKETLSMLESAATTALALGFDFPLYIQKECLSWRCCESGAVDNNLRTYCRALRRCSLPPLINAIPAALTAYDSFLALPNLSGVLRARVTMQEGMLLYLLWHPSEAFKWLKPDADKTFIDDYVEQEFSNRRMETLYEAEWYIRAYFRSVRMQPPKSPTFVTVLYKTLSLYSQIERWDSISLDCWSEIQEVITQLPIEAIFPAARLMTHLAKFARKLKKQGHSELVEPVLNTTVYCLTVKEFREECPKCRRKYIWEPERKEAMLELAGAMALLRAWTRSKGENSSLGERKSDSEYTREEVIASGLKHSKHYYSDLRLCYK